MFFHLVLKVLFYQDFQELHLRFNDVILNLYLNLFNNLQKIEQIFKGKNNFVLYQVFLCFNTVLIQELMVNLHMRYLYWLKLFRQQILMFMDYYYLKFQILIQLSYLSKHQTFLMILQINKVIIYLKDNQLFFNHKQHQLKHQLIKLLEYMRLIHY